MRKGDWFCPGFQNMQVLLVIAHLNINAARGRPFQTVQVLFAVACLNLKVGCAYPHLEKPQLRQMAQPPSCSIFAPQSGQYFIVGAFSGDAQRRATGSFSVFATTADTCAGSPA